MSTARILVIEDNDTNRALMVYLLNAFGYTALEASDGEKGITEAMAGRPHLIICDVHLPKLDGFEVARQLKTDTHLRSIPIIAVTALAMVGDRDRILSAGFDGYISKPIAPETFVHEVEKFLPAELRSSPKPSIAGPVQGGEGTNYQAEALQGSVLVIDDMPDNIEFIRSTLQPSGYTVFAANNIETAVVLAREKKPDLLLCDLHMPPHTGLDLLDLAKTDPTLQMIPVVIISSTGTGSIEEAECLERGATKFIRRPIEPQALLAEIEKTLGTAT